MDEAWKQSRLDELWDATLKLLRDPAAMEGKLKHEIGFEILCLYRKFEMLHREIDEGSACQDDSFLRSITSYMIWQLLSLDTAAWTLKEIYPPNFSVMASNIRAARPQLLAALKSQINIQWPSHGKAIDPAPVFVPRSSLIELVEGLEALQRGEVPEIFRPASTGRHDAPWSWDKMRTRALQYVEFIRGQGNSARVARQRVAVATGVAANTLLYWSQTLKPTEPIDPAFRAGQLKTIIDDNPHFGKSDGNVLDAEAWEYLRNQLAEPLGEFGRTYQERFGRRSSQAPCEGD